MHKMFDESINISVRSWTRTVENINKIGYSDGVTDGQNNSFQSSFDLGYSQGLKFGFELGLKSALAYNEQTVSNTHEDRLRDPSNINCQICLDGTTISQNVVNLYNTQKEKNDNYFNM